MREVNGTVVRNALEEGAIEWGAEILRNGGLVAFPTETVYGLGADGFNQEAVRKIFIAKGRPVDNPLILHIGHRDRLPEVAEGVSEAVIQLAKIFWPGPLTLILKRRATVPAVVSAGLETLAVRCPSHPVALALIETLGHPIAAPSANLSGRPSPTTADHVLEDLAGRIDAVLDGGPTPLGIESTVVDMTSAPPRLLRHGAVPLEELLRFIPGLAVGEGEGMVARPSSPGMKYRHYAPRTRLVLIEGEPEKVADRVAQESSRLFREGLSVALLLTEETAQVVREMLHAGNVQLRTLASRYQPQEVATRLFSVLREVDRLGVDVIIAEGIPAEGWGTAVMDRLVRAAHEVVHV